MKIMKKKLTKVKVTTMDADLDGITIEVNFMVPSYCKTSFIDPFFQLLGNDWAIL